MRDVDELTDLLAALAADAEQVIEHDRLAEAARGRIRANLPLARQAGAGISDLERTIKSVYVWKTISRWVKDSPPSVAPRSRRKRPGAAPDAS